MPVGSPIGDVKSLGRFEIRKRLGAGAFGEVCLAYDPQLDRDVALKVPRASVLRNPNAAKRFLVEARATARLTHPNIVPVFDAGQDSGYHYIASAFIEGRTLDDLGLQAGDRIVLPPANTSVAESPVFQQLVRNAPWLLMSALLGASIR